MDTPVELPFGSNSVRFTSDGRIFIEDAIRVLTDEKEYDPASVWDRMKKDHPNILIYCAPFITKEGVSMQTVDLEGMDVVFPLLLDYL